MLENAKEKIEIMDGIKKDYTNPPKCICCNSAKNVGPNIAQKNPTLDWKAVVVMEDWHCYKCNIDFDE